MPRNSSQWVAHRINGGWATDYGRTFYGSPEGGSLEIPWCNTCENIHFNPDGSYGKYPGLAVDVPYPIKAPISSSGYTESSVVRNLYTYTRLGSSLEGDQYNMAIVGSFLYNYSSTSAVQIGDLSTSATQLHHMATFNDLLIIGAFTPKSWDATTFQSLAGTPPSFSFSTAHAGRHWAAGNTGAPSRLYYSVAGNPEDWVGSGSGSIDIDPGDGDSIVALLSWKRELWVFKGPNRQSIHRISGTSPSDFTRTTFITGVTAAGPHSLFQVGDDFGFWSPRGSCHSMKATDTYGDYAQSYANFPLLSWFRNSNNVQGGHAALTWQAITDRTRNLTYCILNNNVGYAPSYNLAFIMDWNFVTESNPYPHFIRLNLRKSFSAVSLKASSESLIPTLGDKDGHIFTALNRESATYAVTDTSVAIPIRSCVETPALSYGPTVHMKTITAVSVDISSIFSTSTSRFGSLDFSYGGRNIPGQTITFSNQGGTGLGTFVLGTDQLATGADIENFYEHVNGESRAFTYTLVEDTTLSGGQGTDVQVKHFGTLINPSGESLENS